MQLPLTTLLCTSRLCKASATFKKTFFGVIFSRCIYARPSFEPLVADAAQRKNLRLQFDDEPEAEFFKRQINLLRLSLGTLVLIKDHAFLWRWFSLTLNERPTRRIAASLVYVGLEMAGQAMCEKFKNQFREKLIGVGVGPPKPPSFLQKFWLPECEAAKTHSGDPAPIAVKMIKISTWVEELKKQGVAGMTPEGKDIPADDEVELDERV